jgi:NAD(P)-dependent dehydrogenase (short-subunit alcohol dehydrogenase family)
MGGISVLVNNAGTNRRKSALTANGKVWDDIVDINLRSSMQTTRAALPHLKNNGGGAIFFISSVGKGIFTSYKFTIIGVRRFGGAAGQSPYFATKFGINGFSYCVFEDVRHLNIKVCSICPGLVNTEMGKKKGNVAHDLIHNKEGPLEYLSADHLIQGSDIVDSIDFALSCGPTTCPTEIYLETQYAMRKSLRDLAQNLLKPPSKL